MSHFVKLETGEFLNLGHVVRLAFATGKGDDLVDVYFSDGHHFSYFGADRNRIVLALDQLSQIETDYRRTSLQMSRTYSGVAGSPAG